MKQTFKILTSLVLSASFMLSSLAVPVMVGTVEGAKEETAAAENHSADAELAKDIVSVGTEETVLKEWKFDTDGNVEGWTMVSSGDGYKLDAADGVAYIEDTIGSNKKTDLRIDFNSLGLETSKVTKITIDVKTTYANKLTLYYATG